ncbi:MAG: carbohydrate ABC transporter permease [Chloroflexi bacterium]|nr:carbohydrate ABC transporter permease [Chloroflexota bacterium]
MKTEATQKILQYMLLTGMAIIVLFPLYQAVVTSLATEADVSNYPPQLFPVHWNFENFTQALSMAPIPRYLLNSIIQSSLVMLSHLVLASLAAYAFAFIEFPFKPAFFLLFLSTMMIPWEATIIPNYQFITTKTFPPDCPSSDVLRAGMQFFKDLSLVNFNVNDCSYSFKDTYLGLALPYLATAFGTFMVRQFFMAIPRDLFDAAVIDGCGQLRFLMTIAVPLARPALGTLAVYSFLQTYNQYLWPLLVTNKAEMRTVQIGLALLQDQERFLWNVVMAGVVMILVPTFALFIIGNRQLIRGLTAGAVKG